MIDAGGRVLAPGVIDVHAHDDVQLDCDPPTTPSCWHGVTTVSTGSCGFTLAPAKPADAAGYVPTAVYGRIRVEEGKATGTLPGEVLRGG